jgi:TetR/AcrR family transcriptional regulator, regulator of autoinduction and epiphytic fitness
MTAIRSTLAPALWLVVLDTPVLRDWMRLNRSVCHEYYTVQHETVKSISCTARCEATYTPAMATIPYREQMLRVREDAIVQAVNRLLATKGYDLMTVDEVAAEAGMAKASLYKHFTSKEELAGAAMVLVLDRAIAYVDSLHLLGPETQAVQQLESVVRWTLEVQLAGEMPTLPAQNSRLSASLRANREYTDRLIELSDKLGAWITQAQASGDLGASLPPELILYTLYARACDPVLGVLKAAGQYTDRQIIDWLVATTFGGLAHAERSEAKAAKAPVRKAGARAG